MQFPSPQGNELAVYYGAYMVACAVLIAGLGWIFHRAGGIFLRDAFQGNEVLVSAVAGLLDIGFYLVSLGYVAVTLFTMTPMNDGLTVSRIVFWKVGGLMLLLGIAHLFNLLLLALFRQRRSGVAAAAPGA